MDPGAFLSKGKNTPLKGQKLKGETVFTFVGGKMVYDRKKGIIREEGRRKKEEGRR